MAESIRVTDPDVISNIIEAEGISMRINAWTHDVVIKRNGAKVEDAESLYIDIIKAAERMRFKSKYLSKTFICDAIRKNAIMDDPVKDFFEHNKWDNTDRFNDVGEALRLSEDDSEKFRLWMRQGSALVFNTGESQDVQRNFMLILFSKRQGNGKSTLAKKLSLDLNSFGDSSVDLKSKESIRHAYESWIYEYPELSSMFRKSDVNMLKTFITSNSQSFRLPYDKFFTTYPTRTSIIGTTNDEEIFIDDTGSRRFMVINANFDRSCWKDINSIDWKQVWLQARKEYLDGLPVVMSAKQQDRNEMQNRMFSYTSAASYRLMAYINEREQQDIHSVSLVEIIQFLTNQKMDSNTKMIFSTMNKLGYNTIKTKTTCVFVNDDNVKEEAKDEFERVRGVKREKSEESKFERISRKMREKNKLDN